MQQRKGFKHSLAGNSFRKIANLVHNKGLSLRIKT